MISRRIIAGSHSRFLYLFYLFILLIKPTVPASGNSISSSMFISELNINLISISRNWFTASHINTIWWPQTRILCGGSSWISRLWSPSRIRPQNPALVASSAFNVWKLCNCYFFQTCRSTRRIPLLCRYTFWYDHQPWSQYNSSSNSWNAGVDYWTNILRYDIFFQFKF